MNLQQNVGPVFSNLSYFKVMGRLPTQAGISFQEAISFELKEYRKGIRDYFDECSANGEDPDMAQISAFDLGVTINLVILAKLYGKVKEQYFIKENE